MKKSINGLMYDTETAECIADNRETTRGIISKISLYETKKGRFFKVCDNDYDGAFPWSKHNQSKELYDRTLDDILYTLYDWGMNKKADKIAYKYTTPA